LFPSLQGRVTRSEQAAYDRAFGSGRKKRSSSKPRKKKTPKQIRAELRLIFDEIDDDESGGIDVEELEDHAGLLGFGNLTAFEISDLFNEADTNGDGTMDFEEFCAIVENCRDTSSMWKNAGALEQATKRYNNVLAASDSLFAKIQETAAATCEQDDQGRRVAGCSRVLAQFCVMIINGVMLTLLCFFAASQCTELVTLFNSIDQNNAFAIFEEAVTTGEAPDLTSTMNDLGGEAALMSQLQNIFMKAYIPFAVYFVILFIITFVGWTRSQAHLGHVIFGFHVIDMESGEPVGFFGLFLRNFFTIIVMGFAAYFTPQYFLETCAVIQFISFL
jgi:hypothetical protein|tara:strand:- start:647 stop:1642 length:996 start_codon:yes stop_codon:yes gene_type:complete